jgi:predicted nuclease of restriction endonuclease-like (RecB) superfamily
VKDEDERNFYIIETAENSWSKRELDRQINASLFERLVLSKDKKAVKDLAVKGHYIENQNDLLKDPLVLEFLNLKESHTYSENDLETAIIDNVGDFLLELGKGFSFVARQKRISAGADHFYIDLVFYNRLLKSHVLIDLKIGKLKHQDIGQMQMYVNYYDREIKLETENPTIGIILCKEKNDFVIEYSLPKDNNQVFSKEYQLYLPNKAELKAMLSQYL